MPVTDTIAHRETQLSKETKTQIIQYWIQILNDKLNVKQISDQFCHLTHPSIILGVA